MSLLSNIFNLTNEALSVAISIAGPILGGILISGLTVGILQAATHINDPVLGFVPKLVFMTIALSLFGSTLLFFITEFAQTAFAMAAQVKR